MNNDSIAWHESLWIWPNECDYEPNQFIQFRHEFTIETAQSTEINIAVDTNYAMWLNGVFINCGQFHNHPYQKNYDSLPIALKAGQNVLSILVYYSGVNSFQYIKGHPGLIYSISTGAGIIASGTQIWWRRHPSYARYPIPRITPQLQFTFEYDARQDDDWLNINYKNSRHWNYICEQDIRPVEQCPQLQERPIKKLTFKGQSPAKIVAQGVFKRSLEPSTSVAYTMQRDFLSCRAANEIFKSYISGQLDSQNGLAINKPMDGDGIYVIIDLDREEVGFLELDLATDSGTIIDIAYGEHLDDMRVRAEVGGRNFAHRYITRSGRQQFTHYFVRCGGRYLELHISQIEKGFTLYYAGLHRVEYPVETKGNFDSPCSLQNKIYNIGVRTLHLCMFEHYEDTPWREQALYANDSRNQALCGYYCFGQYEFPSVSFELLGGGLKDDGYLELCAPAEISITIPSFSMVWILALADHLLYSGDVILARRLIPKVQKMLDCWLKSLSGGLMPCPQGSRYWHFYDWADGLDGTEYNDCTNFETINSVRFDAPLNFYLCLALDAAAFIVGHCGMDNDAIRYQHQAEMLKKQANDAFFDVEKGLYRTFIGKKKYGEYSELTQALAIYAQVCPMDKAQELRNIMTAENNGLVKVTLSQSLYKFEALMMDKTNYGNYVFEDIRRSWGSMLFKGATSFWETLKGGLDFDNAGSLCHGWSSVPVYFYSAYLLGIRPLEPGFKKFQIDPLKSWLKSCSGQVPTPYGPILLDWQKTDCMTIYFLRHPKEIHPQFLNLNTQDEVRVQLNN